MKKRTIKYYPGKLNQVVTMGGATIISVYLFFNYLALSENGLLEPLEMTNLTAFLVGAMACMSLVAFYYFIYFLLVRLETDHKGIYEIHPLFGKKSVLFADIKKFAVVSNRGLHHRLRVIDYEGRRINLLFNRGALYEDLIESMKNYGIKESQDEGRLLPPPYADEPESLV